MGYGNRKDRTLVLEGLGAAWRVQTLVDYGFEIDVAVVGVLGFDFDG